MSNKPLSTRRNFLRHLTMLTAGAAVVPVGNLFCTGNTTAHLEQQWNTFCRLHKAKPYRRDIRQANEGLMQPSAGHTHKTGNPFYLPDQPILAQPTWVYWGIDAKPADVIVTFFGSDAEQKKICRITGFELEALNLLNRQVTERNSLPVGAAALLPHFLKTGNKKLDIKTMVSKDNIQLSVIQQETGTRIKKNHLLQY